MCGPSCTWKLLSKSSSCSSTTFSHTWAWLHEILSMEQCFHSFYLSLIYLFLLISHHVVDWPVIFHLFFYDVHFPLYSPCEHLCIVSTPRAVFCVSCSMKRKYTRVSHDKLCILFNGLQWMIHWTDALYVNVCISLVDICIYTSNVYITYGSNFWESTWPD